LKAPIIVTAEDKNNSNPNMKKKNDANQKRFLHFEGGVCSTRRFPIKAIPVEIAKQTSGETVETTIEPISGKTNGLLGTIAARTVAIRTMFTVMPIIERDVRMSSSRSAVVSCSAFHHDFTLSKDQCL
jgi:hypothetical protein